MSSSTTTYHTLPLPNGVQMHYATSGPLDAPVLLLLHGYPSSSHQFRHLIPALNTPSHAPSSASGAPPTSTTSVQYRIIAPDLPSFGLTRLPPSLPPSKVTFAYLADTLELFIDALKLGDRGFVMYIFDFGAPTGLRMALKRPEVVKGIITQNGNAYMEGIGPSWAPLRKWWAETKVGDEAYERTKAFLLENQFTLDNARLEYVGGIPDELVQKVDPYSYNIDHALNLASREGKQRQLSLFWDYQNNLKAYPIWQEYIRTSGVPILAVWGRYDGYFPKEGAEAYKRDSPRAEVHILDGGHFLLETHLEEVAGIMKRWLGRIGF